MRTAVQVLREVALIRGQTKGDLKLQRTLVAPLEAELLEIAAALQGQLPGIAPDVSNAQTLAAGGQGKAKA